MFFGATSFGASPFASPGGVSVQVLLNGVQMNFAIGNVVIEGKSLVLPTGQRVNLSTGNVQVVLGQTVLVTGEELALATNLVDVINWNPIIPGATGVWVRIDPDNP
jgi:lipopolysaccharide assembly outer membrane protein LptD (OstA)